MSCAVASIANSPVFSPSRVSLFCKTPSFSSSPENLTLNGSLSSSSPCSSSNGGSSSPFRLRLQKSPSSGLRSFKKEICGASSLNNNSENSSIISASILKRKRQMRIDIPVSSLNFANSEVLSTAAALEESQIEIEREDFSVYCKRGRRASMEDRFSAVQDSNQAFFGVFDGHGGAKAAEFAAQNLHKNIRNESTRRLEIVDAIKHGYLKTDSEFLKEDTHGGSCVVTALISKGDLFVSNAGDCRAVMSRGGVAETLTSDHRPSREDEKHRIENQGGYVDCRHGVWRLQGSLAVSRGLGDQHLKQWVIAEPETKTIKITSDCEFLILASDGLWDKVTNQEAIDIARPLCVESVTPEVLCACKRLAELAVKRGSLDDISVMVVQLRKFC